ncbi:MAG: type VI secretion system ImpA family N-terminal domain-containing protein [Gammaproteobacteria bacterium]
MRIADSGLLESLSAENPCGEDLEDTQLLASFDAYRVFGQSAPLSEETDWREIRDRSLEALRKSKDLRLLTHLAGSVVRTEGFGALAETLSVGARWFEMWGGELFPRVDEDAILRRNALNGFADRMAVVDGARRAPILKHAQLGAVSIRDIEMATGQLAPTEGETASMDNAQLGALLSASADDDLKALSTQLNQAVESLKSMEAAMRDQGGAQAAPEFDSLCVPLARTLKLIDDHLATRSPAASEAAGETGGNAAAGGAVAVGAIRNRQDATRALDAVAAFFRTNEPSSPIPLLLERAKRLVAKDFLEVLAELAPEALGPAKAASGVRDSAEA